MFTLTSQRMKSTSCRSAGQTMQPQGSSSSQIQNTAAVIVVVVVEVVDVVDVVGVVGVAGAAGAVIDVTGEG